MSPRVERIVELLSELELRIAVAEMELTEKFGDANRALKFAHKNGHNYPNDPDCKMVTKVLRMHDELADLKEEL